MRLPDGARFASVDALDSSVYGRFAGGFWGWRRRLMRRLTPVSATWECAVLPSLRALDHGAVGRAR